MSTTLPQGYEVFKRTLDETDLAGLRGAITETIDRTARALRAPFEASAPDLPPEQRLEHVAQRDHAYGSALFHAVMADAHRDARVMNLAAHPRLSETVRRLVAPKIVTGHIVRPRAVIPAFAKARSPWHQDVLRPSTTAGSCGSVQCACWIPLGPVDEHTGALELIPGSWASPLPHVMTDAGHFQVESQHLPSTPRETVPLEAGDVLVLDRFIPHRSLPVRAGCVRWAIVMWIKAIGPDQNV